MPNTEQEVKAAEAVDVAALKGQVYAEKTFNRDFEKTYGFLKPAQFPPIDWANKADIQRLFPAYERELIAFENSRKGPLVKTVEIIGFNLQTPYKDRYLFKNAKLYIEPNKRCAVYGENGSGKTSIFKAIAAGEVRDFPKWMHVHHMKELEHNDAAEGVSVMDTILCSHPMRRVCICMEEILVALAASEEDEKVKEGLLGNLKYVQGKLTKLSSDTAIKRVQQMLRVLGFDEVGEQAPLSSLSGGLRMRVALASAFFIDPELLLLDEPTNHLDMPSVLWLENRLRAYKGSYLLVTHDRTLLENVVTSVMLLQDEQISYFPTGFKKFEQTKVQLDKKRDKDIDKFMARNRNIGNADPLYRTKMKYMEWQQKRNERLIQLQGKFTFKDPKALKAPAGVEQKDISLIKVDNVRFSYSVEKGLPFIFDTPISYEITMKTRIGVMGPNGAGKSTFLKLITGKIQATEGAITSNPDYSLAYFGQHSTKELKMDMTAIEFMVQSFPKAKEGALKLHLAKTSISDDVANKRMQNLSFSQRSCIIFAKLTFVPPHLLIMDEPTNFLDLPSVDSLIMATNKFNGALIVVTHNRDFLKRCSKNFLSIVPGSFQQFGSMKEAERATYSFIGAMERGEDIDVKNAIKNNRGGGAIISEEDRKATADRVEGLKAAKSEADRKAAEAAAKEQARLEAIEAEKKAKAAAKAALIRLDWKVGEVCWAPLKVSKNGTSYARGTIKRNIPGMGCTVDFDSGKSMMIAPKKLREKNPNPNQGGNQGGKGGGKGGKGGSRKGGKGGSRKGGKGGNRGKGKGGGKGGNRNRGKGGGRGGKGGGNRRGGGARR